MTTTPDSIGALVERVRSAHMYLADRMVEIPEDLRVALLQSLTDLTRERDEARTALNRQADNMAFVLSHATLPDQYYSKFSRELEEDRATLRTAASSGRG